MADLTPAWIGLTGVGIGGVISFAGTLATMRHQRRLEEVRNEVEATRATDTFQVETLLELQIAMQELAEWVYKAAGTLNNHPEYNNAVELPGMEWPERILRQRVLLLALRVRYDDTRQQVEKLLRATREFAHAQTREAGSGVFDEFGVLHGRLLRLTADQIRRLPAPAAYRPVLGYGSHMESLSGP